MNSVLGQELSNVRRVAGSLDPTHGATAYFGGTHATGSHAGMPAWVGAKGSQHQRERHGAIAIPSGSDESAVQCR